VYGGIGKLMPRPGSVRRRLLLFVKRPVEGTVKTRLARAIGSEAASALYRCLVSDSLSLARQAGYPTSVFFHPPEGRQAVSEWLGNEFPCLPQEGNDLGERMYAAFQTAFLDAREAVLIGSDIPDLPPPFIREAFESLGSCGAVIGPARDGGYYLIGFSAETILSAPFADMEWGTPTVCQDTMERLGQNGLKVHVLPAWRDLDEYGDLEAFFDAHKDLPEGRLATIDFLRRRFHS
jgi:uncharacterized protein